MTLTHPANAILHVNSMETAAMITRQVARLAKVDVKMVFKNEILKIVLF